MSHRKLLTALDSLPADAQRQVADFIVLLQRQHELAVDPGKENGADLSRQPFIGMWRDREDMTDSSAWVRKTRQREWPNA